MGVEGVALTQTERDTMTNQTFTYRIFHANSMNPTYHAIRAEAA